MTQAWIRDGLRERAITRDLKWGIPVPKPGFENKVFYVWFDAPIGYVSITGNLEAERGGDWRKFVDYWWKRPGEVELFQFIGKDNIPFHTVIFPSAQLGTGGNWTMLHHMSSTEYLNYESGKFSKSKGVGVFGTDVRETGIPADVWRFYIFYNRPEKSDALFTWKDFGEKVNSELIGNLGNFVNRTLSFVTRYYGGEIPPPASEGEADGMEAFRQKVKDYEAGITEKLEWAELRDAFHLLFELSSFANKTFQDGAPWKARTEAPAKAAALIRALSLLVRDFAVLSAPFMPEAAAKIAGFFGKTLAGDGTGGADAANAEAALSWADLGRPDGIERVVTSSVLFERLEEARIAGLRERYSGAQSERDAELEKRFAGTLDLRTARIVKVERHPDADKLYIETLEIGGEERVIVSGLAPFYKEEELLNKTIIVAYNLKAAKLRGVESRGMLLAASAKASDGSEAVEVLDAGDVPTGTRAHLEGTEAPTCPLPEVDIDGFLSIPITVRGNTVRVGGKALCLAGIPVKTARVTDGKVR
jgi:methionyl-tRNA synthetase